MMMFVVVANSEEKQKVIATSIEAAGHGVKTLLSLSELPELLKEVPVSGIVIDLITSTRSSKLEKEETNDLIQLYPNIKVKIVNNNITIMGQPLSLQQFVEDCQTFKPRTIRKSARRIRHIAFLLSPDATFNNPEKVVTLNIGDSGCFIYSASEWQVGDRIWLRFIDNEKVMTAVVCWWQPWGNNKKMPGIGVKFD